MEKKRRVLLVDDEENILFTLSEAISRLGDSLEIQTARNGQEALRILRKTPVDLLITDLVMPEIDGIVLTKVAYAMYPETRVIWITSYDPHDDDAQHLLVDRNLIKPLDIAVIRRIVCEELGIPYLNGHASPPDHKNTARKTQQK